MVSEVLDRRGVRTRIALVREPGFFSIGPVGFSESGLHELVSYVWRGGYPTWKGFEEGSMPREVHSLAKVFPFLGRVG